MYPERESTANAEVPVNNVELAAKNSVKVAAES